jgi:hypothetical protein
LVIIIKKSYLMLISGDHDNPSKKTNAIEMKGAGFESQTFEIILI